MSENISDAVGQFVERMVENRQPRDGEYLDEDGLLHCSKCHKPVQCRITIWNQPKIVRCICDCRKRELEEQKQREEELAREMHIRQLKANGIQEKHLLDWRFETAVDSRDIQRARKYVEQWQKVKVNNLGLLLWGDVGTGKSFMAACIANALLERGTPVLMTNFSKILNQMGALYSDERYQYIASFSNYSLLIIDDLGIERNTEYALEQVYAVIDERYKSGLPVIITTNLTVNELRNPVDVAYARIYSRVLEMCTPVQVSGSDRRTAIGRTKQNTVKEVLGI